MRTVSEWPPVIVNGLVRFIVHAKTAQDLWK
jgi:hypothetical protein